MPTNQPKKRTKKTRTQAHTRTHSHTREISEGNVGSEAQFFARENEAEFRLGLDFRVGLQGHLSKTPSDGVSPYVVVAIRCNKKIFRTAQGLLWRKCLRLDCLKNRGRLTLWLRVN